MTTGYGTPGMEIGVGKDGRCLSSQAALPPSGLSPEDGPQAKPAAANAEALQQPREWTLWSDQRTPDAAGAYRFRASFEFLGLTVTAEWTEEQKLCGMGYGDSEWWPLRPCYWDGYRRYITNPTLEWSALHAYDPEGTVWHGLHLLPCPFTGKAPKLEPQGQYIGAPLWRSEAVWISSPAVPKRRWTNAKAMQAAWNTRALASCDTRPKDEDPLGASLASGAVPQGDAQTSEVNND